MVYFYKSIGSLLSSFLLHNATSSPFSPKHPVFLYSIFSIMFGNVCFHLYLIMLFAATKFMAQANVFMARSITCSLVNTIILCCLHFDMTGRGILV